MSTAPPIFLSASVPYGKRAEIYPPAPTAIREAVRGLVAAALPRFSLVFGGHPAISPMIWEDASSLGEADRVYIYQSQRYHDSVPQETHYFSNLVWTPEEPGATPEIAHDRSLALMRNAMIVRRIVKRSKMRRRTAAADLPPFAAAVFIGGMNGVVDEWDLFRAHYPDAPALVVASTQGATLTLMADAKRKPSYKPEVKQMLARDRRYRHVFRTLLPP